MKEDLGGLNEEIGCSVLDRPVPPGTLCGGWGREKEARRDTVLVREREREREREEGGRVAVESKKDEQEKRKGNRNLTTTMGRMTMNTRR